MLRILKGLFPMLIVGIGLFGATGIHAACVQDQVNCEDAENAQDCTDFDDTCQWSGTACTQEAVNCEDAENAQDCTDFDDRCSWVEDVVEEAESTGNTQTQDEEGGRVYLENPIAFDTPLATLGNVIKVGMGVVGAITLLIFVYGGFMWITAAGNAEQVKKGTQAMLWAVIGIVVIFSSYAIISLVLKGLIG